MNSFTGYSSSSQQQHPNGTLQLQQSSLNNSRPPPPPVPPRPQPYQNNVAMSSQVVDDMSDLGRLKRPPPVTHSAATPPAVLYTCPANFALSTPMTWYTTSALPDLDMCSACHAEFVSGTPAAANWIARQRENVTCDFPSPRMRALLRSGNVDQLVAFVRRRQTIPACKGGQGVTGAQSRADGVKWYHRAQRHPNDAFIACEACIEDVAKATSWGDMFTPKPDAQPDGETWACDLHQLFNAVTLRRAAASGPASWNAWVADEQRRTAIPACGAKVEPHTRSWFTTRVGIDGFVICDACYYDRVLTSSFGSEFVQVAPVHGMTCDFADTKAQLAWSAAVDSGDFGTFHRGVTVMLAEMLNPASRTFFSLGGVDWDVCGSCHACIITPLGLGQFFVPAHGQHTCDLCPESRFPMYLSRLVETIFTGSFEKFGSTARDLVGVPVCPRRETAKDANWYGWEWLYICPECWVGFAKDTPQASQVPFVGVRPQHTICALYSPRMRELWLKSSVQQLLPFAKQREETYVATMMKANHLVAMKRIEMTRASAAANASLILGAADSLKIATGATDGHYHGNANVGYTFLTSEGAQSAQQFQNMQSIASNVVGTGWPQIIQLESLWMQVE